MEGILPNLTIETGGTEKEASEVFDAALRMEVEGYEEDEGMGEGKEDDAGALRALGYLKFLTQDADPSGTTLVDAQNGFNELSRLAMLWTVCHRCPEGARFVFNFSRHWAQLILHHPG